MRSIDFSEYHSIVILSGAGVSVASGIPAFRGSNGLWANPEVARLSRLEGLQEDPAGVWKFWSEIRRLARQAAPNPAHQALAALEKALRPGQNFLLITQNVDGLHQRAGSRNVVELHGSIHRSRCSNAACTLQPFGTTNVEPAPVPTCPVCGAALRPDIVFFDEALPVEAEWRSKRALRDCDLFIAIGTSGTVSPASDFVRGAEYAGARTIYINPEPMNPPNRYFQEILLGKAEEVLPKLIV